MTAVYDTKSAISLCLDSTFFRFGCALRNTHRKNVGEKARAGKPLAFTT